MYLCKSKFCIGIHTKAEFQMFISEILCHTLYEEKISSNSMLPLLFSTKILFWKLVTRSNLLMENAQ